MPDFLSRLAFYNQARLFICLFVHLFIYCLFVFLAIFYLFICVFVYLLLCLRIYPFAYNRSSLICHQGNRDIPCRLSSEDSEGSEVIETINMFAVPLLLGDIWIGCALKEKGRLFGHKTLQARLQTSATVVGSRYSKLSGKRKIVRKSQKYSNDRKANQPDPTVFPLHGSLGKNLQKFGVYLSSFPLFCSYC